MWKTVLRLALVAKALAAPVEERSPVKGHVVVEERQSAPSVSIGNGTVVGMTSDGVVSRLQEGTLLSILTQLSGVLQRHSVRTATS